MDRAEQEHLDEEVVAEGGGQRDCQRRQQPERRADGAHRLAFGDPRAALAILKPELKTDRDERGDCGELDRQRDEEQHANGD